MIFLSYASIKKHQLFQLFFHPDGRKDYQTFCHRIVYPNFIMRPILLIPSFLNLKNRAMHLKIKRAYVMQDDENGIDMIEKLIFNNYAKNIK